MNNDDVVIEFDHVTKMYKLFKNDKKDYYIHFVKKLNIKKKEL